MFKSLYRIQEHPNRRLGEAVLNVRGAIVAVLVLLLYQTFFSEVFAYAIMWFNEIMGTSFGMVELNLVVDLATLSVLILFFGRFYWVNLVNFFREFKSEYIWGPIVCYIIAIEGNFAVQMLLTAIRGDSQSTTNNEIINDMLIQNPIQIILITVIIAPIVEETLFRAGLCRVFTANKNYFIKTLGFIISVFIFAFMHVYQYAFFATDANGAWYFTFNANEFLSILVYIPMAIAFAACSYLCKNFWGSVLCHMLTNGISISLMLLTNFAE